MGRVTTASLSKLVAARGRLDPQGLTSALLLAWSVLYALPHLYWGVGGTFGHFSLKPTAPGEDGFEAANLVAFVLITLAGFIGLVLERAQRLPRPRLALLGIAAVGCAFAAAHGAYGILFRISQIASISDIDGDAFNIDDHGWVLWDMFLFEPWFLVEGILLGLVGYYAQRSEKEQDLWLILVSVLSLFALLTAFFEVQVF